ncbi:hypothetical protein CG651_001184 [Salmonella enterica]|nr:hypothetical protein [Salmonella enterica]
MRKIGAHLNTANHSRLIFHPVRPAVNRGVSDLESASQNHPEILPNACEKTGMYLNVLACFGTNFRDGDKTNCTQGIDFIWFLLIVARTGIVFGLFLFFLQIK